MSQLTIINALLENNGMDLTRVGFARHPYSNKNVRNLYDGHYMDLSMSLQNKGRFDKYDYVLSFLGFPDEMCLFLCGYRILGCKRDAKKFLKEYPFQEHISDRSVYYQLERLPFLEKYNEKLLVRWGEGARAWLQNGTNTKAIEEVYEEVLGPVAYISRVTGTTETSLKSVRL